MSIYAVDARGLDTGRALDQSRQYARSLRPHQPGAVAFRQKPEPVTLDDVDELGAGGGCAADRYADCAACARRRDSGALIANTNDLGPGLVDRVRTDLDSYYEIGYTPGSGAADGRFRPIEVKIARRGISIHSRSGYFALPRPTPRRSCPFELPMLSAAAARRRRRRHSRYSACGVPVRSIAQRHAAHGRRRGATRTSDVRGEPQLANLWAPVHGDDAGEGSERTNRPAVE